MPVRALAPAASQVQPTEDIAVKKPMPPVGSRCTPATHIIEELSFLFVASSVRVVHNPLHLEEPIVHINRGFVS